MNLAFWKFTIIIRKARTRFTYKLFLTLRPIETKTTDNHLLNLAKGCFLLNNQSSIIINHLKGSLKIATSHYTYPVPPANTFLQKTA